MTKRFITVKVSATRDGVTAVSEFPVEADNLTELKYLAARKLTSAIDDVQSATHHYPVEPTLKGVPDGLPSIDERRRIRPESDEELTERVRKDARIQRHRASNG